MSEMITLEAMPRSPGLPLIFFDVFTERRECGKNTNSRVAHVSFVSIFLIWSRFFLMLRLITPQCVAYH